MSGISAAIEWLDSNLVPILVVLVGAIVYLGQREWKYAKKRRAELAADK